jgi:hemoglobin
MSWLTDQLNLNDVLRVIQRFYIKAQQHPSIGHYFEGIDNFSSHEKKISEFWWLALGGKVDDLPDGAPSIDMINIHIALSINADDLKIWLGLFEQTLFEKLEMDLASAWQIKLHEIANHLKALAIDGKAGGIQITESR